MLNEKIDVVMFSMSCYTEWQHGISNRNFHILHNLLKNDQVRKVVMVEYLPFTLKRAVRQWFQNIIFGVKGKILSRGLWHKLVAISEEEIEKTGYKLDGYEPNSIPFKLFIYSDVSSIWSEKGVYKRLAHELERLDIKNVVLWSYLPTFVDYFKKFKEVISVFDAVDNWMAHSSYIKIRDRLKKNYQVIRYKADFIFTTSPELVKFFDRHSHTFFVPNGVNIEQIENTPKLVGRDVASLPHPIIGYYGTITEDRFDVDLLRYLAEHNSTKSFAIIGPVWPGLKKSVHDKLKPLANIHLLGRKSYAETRAYLKEFDLVIIPHLQNVFNTFTNPMKFYECLGAGKPVVSTPAPGLDKFRDIVHIANNPESFNREILKALEENSPEDINKRRQIAQENTWEKRVEVMLEQVFKQFEKLS